VVHAPFATEMALKSYGKKALGKIKKWFANNVVMRRTVIETVIEVVNI
jgi:hypothetical protein